MWSITKQNMKLMFGNQYTRKILLPKGNKVMLTQLEYQSIKFGISMFVTATFLYQMLFMYLLLEGTTKPAMVSGILITILEIFLPVVLFFYIRITRQNRKTAWPFYLFLYVVVFTLIPKITMIRVWFDAYTKHEWIVLLGIVSLVIYFFSFINIISGCQSICIRSRKLYRKKAKPKGYYKKSTTDSM